MGKLTQSAAFGRIRELGFIVRKTDCNEYRVADPSQPYLDGTREASAAYCGDLQEAIDTAEFWAAHKATAAAIGAV